jgi:hypothetical protein
VDLEESITAFARPPDLEVHGPLVRAPKQPRARRSAAPVPRGVVDEGRPVPVQAHVVSAFDPWSDGTRGTFALARRHSGQPHDTQRLVREVGALAVPRPVP